MGGVGRHATGAQRTPDLAGGQSRVSYECH